MDLYMNALSFSVHLLSFVELVYSFSGTGDYFFCSGAMCFRYLFLVFPEHGYRQKAFWQQAKTCKNVF